MVSLSQISLSETHHDPIPRPLRVGFVMSTEVGLRTQYLNWRTCLGPEMGVDPTWAVIEWYSQGGLLERLPLLPGAVKSRIRAQFELREGLGQNKLDILFVAVPSVFYGQDRWLRSRPYVLDMDSTPEQLWEFGELYGKGRSSMPFVDWVKWRIRRRQFLDAVAIFPWSRWAAESLVDRYGVDPARLHVIPPGVDLEHWTFPPRADGPPRILFVGGDFYRKGGDLLLEWADRTRTEGWQLDLVTRDPVTSSHPNVRVHNGLTSNSPELRRLYAEANVFALPTRGDCYSIASVEAMAAGLPIILSKVGGTGDIVRDGETGFYIPPGDGAALATHLDALVADRSARRRMGQAARRDAEARYDARHNIQRTVAIMRAALGWWPFPA